MGTADVLAAGPARVAESTGGLLASGDTVLLFALLAALASSGSVRVSRAEMRVWSTPGVLRGRTAMGPVPTIIVRRGPTPAPSAPHEAWIVEELDALGQQFAPKRWFELVDLFHRVRPPLPAPPHASPERAPHLARELTRYVEALGGAKLRFGPVSMQTAEVVAFVTQARGEL